MNLARRLAVLLELAPPGDPPSSPAPPDPDRMRCPALGAIRRARCAETQDAGTLAACAGCTAGLTFAVRAPPPESHSP